MSYTICIPVHSNGHPMLMECVQNIRDTTGKEPLVITTKENVSVARRMAMMGTDSTYVCFVDTDAFPQEKGWIDMLVETAEATKAALTSPIEVLLFGESKHPLSHVAVDGGIVRCSSPSMSSACVLIRRGYGVWDENMGLTDGFLGPCIEDVDFAFSVSHQSGEHVIDPRVHFIHKDRGTDTFDAWTRTDEFRCYSVMSALVSHKWDVVDDLDRASFFSKLGKVPCQNQRWLASGYTPEDLIACYSPVAENLPLNVRSRFLGFVEMILSSGGGIHA